MGTGQCKHIKNNVSDSILKVLYFMFAYSILNDGKSIPNDEHSNVERIHWQ